MNPLTSDSPKPTKASGKSSLHGAAFGDGSGKLETDSQASKSTSEKSSPESFNSLPSQSVSNPEVMVVSSCPPTSLQVDVSVNDKEERCVAQTLKVASSKLVSNDSSKKSEGMERVAYDPIQSHGLKGAWTKKLNLLASSSQHPRVGSGMWPSLNASKSTHPQQAHTFQKPVTKEDDIRFPWAAKMNPSLRNLYRATEPEYLEDGTPKVTIPRHVFLQGLENQKEYVLGQFYRCSPPSGGLIYAVFNKLWGRNCRITIRKLGDSSYLFHIPEESTRNWVLQRGLWHVDDCLMFVAPWTLEASLGIPEIKTVPVWVTLKKIPNILYSIPGISHIASGLGAPMATHKPRLDPILMGEAKILVEVELSKAFPSRIAADDENGFISMVDVEYAWLPSKCGRCGQLGHKVKHCLQAASESGVVDTKIVEIASVDGNVVTTSASNTLVKYAQPISTSTPVVGIEVSPPNIILDANNESNSVDSTFASADELISLATISVLENMASPSALTFICINETIETPISESVQILSATDTSTAQATSTVGKESNRVVELDFGSNKFASLISFEEEEDSSDSDKEMDPMDLMTPSGKRILRERPVKPSGKARALHLQSMAGGRGNRGRGNRGGRG